jgi:hypothetical protein
MTLFHISLFHTSQIFAGAFLAFAVTLAFLGRKQG